MLTLASLFGFGYVLIQSLEDPRALGHADMARSRIRNCYFMWCSIALHLVLSTTRNRHRLHMEWLDCVRPNTFMGGGGAAPYNTTGPVMFDTFILDRIAAPKSLLAMGTKSRLKMRNVQYSSGDSTLIPLLS